MIKNVHFVNDSSRKNCVENLIFEYGDESKSTDIVFYCAMIEGYTTLQACEVLCDKHSSCYTVATANDDIVEILGE